MRNSFWAALLAVAAAAACVGDNQTAGQLAAEQCRNSGGVPHGSSPEDLICLAAAPSDAQRFEDVVLDTDRSSLCAEPMQAPEGCVVAATSISITGRLRAIGRRPLILVADTIEVTATGVIDVAAHSGDDARPAGADPASCAPDAPLSYRVRCGAGGSFGGVGGNNNITDLTHCAGAVAAEDTAVVRGGCSGRRGGEFSSEGGAGGRGGGGVLLIARSATLDGKINASGAGGGGAAPIGQHGGNEGGGGGSGGMIAIDVRAISGSGIVMANGGGGGSGDGQYQKPSPPGSDPDEASPMTAAPGGPGAMIVGYPDPLAPGGAGGAGATLDGADGQHAPILDPVRIDFSAGGGGGSAGVVRFYAARFAGVVSPAA